MDDPTSILSLPSIVMPLIFRLLTVRETALLASTCKRFREIADQYCTGDNRWYFGKNSPKSLTRQLFQTLYYFENDPSKHKPIPLVPIFCDAPQYDEKYSLDKLCCTGSVCFCTKDVPENVNVLITLGPIEGYENNDDLVMFVTQLDIRDPETGYTAPLDNSLVYISHEKPDPEVTITHNNMTKMYYLENFANKSIIERQEKMEPLFFTSCSERREEHNNEELSTWIRQDMPRPCPVGRWVLFKMLSSSGAKTNIDVGYFGVRGFVFDMKKMEVVNFPDMEVDDGPVKGCSIM